MARVLELICIVQSRRSRDTGSANMIFEPVDFLYFTIVLWLAFQAWDGGGGGKRARILAR